MPTIKKEPAMINWETEMDKALARARTEGKSILLDFFNPG
jgi:hypothetical protein